MLVVKEVGIEKYKIQIPTSMVKVNKSKTKPLHTYVALSIRKTYPSSVQWCTGKLFNDEMKDPTQCQIEEIKAMGPDVLKVRYEPFVIEMPYQSISNVEFLILISYTFTAGTRM